MILTAKEEKIGLRDQGFEFLPEFGWGFRIVLSVNKCNGASHGFGDFGEVFIHDLDENPAQGASVVVIGTAKAGDDFGFKIPLGNKFFEGLKELNTPPKIEFLQRGALAF